MPRDGRRPRGPANMTPDGDYIVGKGRPPEHSKFRKGDGRKRGRRPKGTRNLATDVREVLESAVSLSEGGVPKKVTRQRAVVLRVADNATKGQMSAAALLLDLQQRLVDPLLQRENEGRQREYDLSCLSDVELDALVYLSAKLEGAQDMNPEVVGVIPIYKAGHYFSFHVREDIERGLGSYGLTNHELPPCSQGISASECGDAKTSPST